MIHRHKWVAQDVEQCNYSSPQTKTVTRRTTRVLYRCLRCTDVKVNEIEGHWTLEQVLGFPKGAK